MRKLRMTNDFDHDWYDLSVFEKLPVHKSRGKAEKHDEWRRNRKALRKAKHMTQRYA